MNQDKEDVMKAAEEEFYQHLFTNHTYWNQPDPNYEEQLRWEIIERMLKTVIDETKTADKNLRILDVGCGRGWMTKLLSQFGQVTGIEPVEPVVKYANQIFPELDIRVGTTKDLQNEQYKKSFNLIVCSEVIEHIPDELKKDFINDLQSLLSSKGFLIITTPRKEAQEEWLTHSSPNQPIEDWLDEKTLEAYFTSCGFTTRTLDRFSIPPVPGAPFIEIYQLWLFQLA